LRCLALAGTLLAVAPAAAAPPAAATPVGTLVIVGGGGMPNTIRDRFLELAGGKKARLVIIPTASYKADRPELLKSWGYWKAQEVASVTLLHTRDRKQANDPKFVKPLTEATGAWISGGDQSLLAAAYHGTAVERELQKLLARGGVIGGTSAGASIMSSVMITGGNPDAQTGTGFGLLPQVVIDQHFDNRHRLKRLMGVVSKYPQYLGIGIDEQTAVEIRGTAAWVLGNEKVSICIPASGPLASEVRVLKAGDRLDLLAVRHVPTPAPKKDAAQPMNKVIMRTALSP
jgi:cyanophycinase